jgi:cytochrome c551/c552
MNEATLIPQYAASLHPSAQDIAAVFAGLRQVAVVFRDTFNGLANAVKNAAQTIADWWKRCISPRAPRIRRHSKQSRDFLSIVNASKRSNEIHAKPRRRRSSRKGVQTDGIS